jgi:UDPglucose 6-dehydrogenase
LKIGVVGLGYVGSVLAAVLASQGHEVFGVDVDKSKVHAFSQGRSPLFEPGLDELLSENLSRLSFSTSYDVLRGCEVVFLAVPTPTVNSEINLNYVFDAAQSVAKVTRECVLAIKSTVIPGTARRLKKLTGLKVASNPEFTREGSAVKDTLFPDRVVIGYEEKAELDLLHKVWSFVRAPIIQTTYENAELIKYASNAFLAVKLSFINEIANLCEKIPTADVDVVARGMGLDKRIGSEYLKAGLGWGGSCLPKDTSALLSFASSLGVELKVLRAAVETNRERIEHVLCLLKKLQKKSVCVLGLAFKQNTDDLRESQSLKLVARLIEEDFKVRVYDPAIKSAPSVLPAGVLCASIKDCVEECEVIVIATEWEEFSKLELPEKLVIDARRVIEPTRHNVRAIGRWQE